MNLQWTDAELAFRNEVRAFFSGALTDDMRHAARYMTSVYSDHGASLAFQKQLALRGWGAPSWDRVFGGCDWNAVQRYIFAQERLAAGAPPPPLGINLVGPAIIAFGTSSQKKLFLPGTLSGDIYWCQGYSEPQSGSDLASLKTSAMDDGSDLVCTGSKIWTSHAHVANWMFALVRSSREQKKQQGLTFVLIDMSSPGISVRPIVMSSGEHIQNEVFFDGVRVPKENVLGEIGGGWSVAKFQLEFERSNLASAPELHLHINHLRSFAANIPGDTCSSLLDEPAFSRKLAAARARASALELYELRTLSALSSGGSPGLAASVLKILGTELSQHVTELALEAAGHYGRAYQPQELRPGGDIHLPHASTATIGPLDAALAPLRYLNDRSGSIFAGSNEIQRNILAKAALGV
ncbi:MAG: acyl-CoA dehydrogenase [Hydrocarboniphaga sp.]|uniref:acyl-CoA dehydrogenase family protein n=1 Tax=Hydrocarboniphaga sp. TaxID=2033016 RepID=UPI002639D8AA|nr:acyl-CoA dehydrogenase family protein [Hydrocarboniphaga sp.]MDB5967854.1 acyl-CoA dehydrogenase [Hydrocarboniphaga sp.]